MLFLILFCAVVVEVGGVGMCAKWLWHRYVRPMPYWVVLLLSVLACVLSLPTVQVAATVRDPIFCLLMLAAVLLCQIVVYLAVFITGLVAGKWELHITCPPQRTLDAVSSSSSLLRRQRHLPDRQTQKKRGSCHPHRLG